MAKRLVFIRCDDNLLTEDEKMCIKFMGMNMDDNDKDDYENGTDFVIDEQGRGLWNGSNPPPRIQASYPISLPCTIFYVENDTSVKPTTFI